MGLYNLISEQNKMVSQEKLTPTERVRLWRIAHRDDPAYRQRKREESQRYLQKLRQDPERYQKYLERQRLSDKRRRVRKKQERTDLDKVCPICGEEFRAYNSNQKICPKEACKKKYHSIQAYASFKKKRALTYQGCFKNCVICGQKFQAKGRAICCSRECSRKRRNERTLTRYHKEKNS